MVVVVHMFLGCLLSAGYPYSTYSLSKVPQVPSSHWSISGHVLACVTFPWNGQLIHTRTLSLSLQKSSLKWSSCHWASAWGWNARIIEVPCARRGGARQQRERKLGVKCGDKNQCDSEKGSNDWSGCLGSQWLFISWHKLHMRPNCSLTR